MAVPYDYKSFESICQTFKNEQVIVTRPDSALRSVQDIVETARKRPGVLSYGHPGLTTIPHLAMTELSRMAKVEFNQIPFKGPAEAVQMSHAGQIDFASVPLPSAAASGLRFLGLFAPARNPLLADVPTLKEQGYDIAPLSFGAFVARVGWPRRSRCDLATLADRPRWEMLMSRPRGAFFSPAITMVTAPRSLRIWRRTLRRNGDCWPSSSC
jgi:tripartite-type tricarboxylate transporter receptor subunit TctC